MLLASLSLFTAPALSADGVLLYNGNGGWSETTLSSFTSTVTAIGADRVDATSSWPADFSAYRLLFLWATTTSYDSAQISDLEAFMAGGGLLVMVSDGVNNTSATVYNEILSTLGYSSTFTAAEIDSACTRYAYVNDADNFLAQGMGDLGYAYASYATAGGSGSEVFMGESGYPIVVSEGSVVLIGDMNIFLSGCDLSGNLAFYENLFNGNCNDQDGDGYLLESCLEKGEAADCNNGDASIYPGAKEIPDDGVDQDCSGFDTVTCLEDLDEDGWGSDVFVYGEGDCSGDFMTDLPGDCDDLDPDSNPDGTEIIDDGVDQDCNEYDAVTCYLDNDGDGWGSDVSVVLYDADCVDYMMVSNSEDCDDSDNSINPDATDWPDDGIDQDCDGLDTVSPEGGDSGLGGLDSGLADTGDDGEGMGSDDDKGCSSSGQPAGLLLLLMSAAALRRRRVQLS